MTVKMIWVLSEERDYDYDTEYPDDRHEAVVKAFTSKEDLIAFVYKRSVFLTPAPEHGDAVSLRVVDHKYFITYTALEEDSE